MIFSLLQMDGKSELTRLKDMPFGAFVEGEVWFVKGVCGAQISVESPVTTLSNDGYPADAMRKAR